LGGSRKLGQRNFFLFSFFLPLPPAKNIADAAAGENLMANEVKHPHRRAR